MIELELNEGEQILYECYGKLRHVIREMKPSGRFKSTFWRNPVQVTMSSGKIIITNNRIIAQGGTEVKGGRVGGGADIISSLIVPLMSGHSKRDKIRKELPRNGHEIPLINVGKLRKNRKNIIFEVKGGNLPGIVIIKPSKTSQVKLEEYVPLIIIRDNLFELLSEFNGIDYSLLKDRLRPLICCAVFIIVSIIGTYISNLI